MFPQIIGLLAFDTPFLGISPGVIAHGAEGHYKTASTAYSAFSELSSAFGWGGAASPKSGTSSPTTTPTTPKPSQPAGLITNGNTDAAASPRWQSWGKYAMFAGAAGAVAAGGAAALYSQREKLSSGWGWIGGHLEFVGCLLRGEELRKRVERVSALSHPEATAQEERGKESEGEKRRSGHFTKGGGKGKGKEKGNEFQGSAIFYTLLGRGANTTTTPDSGTAKILIDGTTPSKRTFCKLPPEIEKESKARAQKSLQNGSGSGQTTTGGQEGLLWIPALNDKAADEIGAHTSMFYPRDNPGFYALGEKSKGVVVDWVQSVGGEWYEGSDDGASTTGKAKAGAGAGAKGNSNNNHRGRGSGGFGAGAGGKTYGEVRDGDGDQGGWETNDGGAGNRAKRRQMGKGTATAPAPTGMSEADSVWVNPHDAEEDRDEDVRMRDGSVDAEDLESSVVVDKAG
jgi:hypothetical protein